MSNRVCYIRRADRGGALRGLRLLGGHADESWQGNTGNDPSLIAQAVEEGARWIRDRLDAKAGASRTLSVLCLDPDGAVCSWVKPEDADESLLDAVITGSSTEYDPDALEPETHSGLSERFPQLPMELSFEFLDPDETSTGSRAAVMASPDVPGRLLKDELDAMGIRVEKFTSIWHAIACVWDPGAQSPAHSAQRIVSSDAPIAAVIAIDPDDARLIWTWSRQGRLIAAGTSRITVAQGEHENNALIRTQDIARLVGDWLGWSSQLGLAPSRIVFVGKPGQLESPITEGEQQPSRKGLSAGEIGSTLSKSWPEATIDLLEHDDPIGETLERIASGRHSSELVSLSSLSNRPGRTHRSMYRWASLSLVAVSVIFGILAYQLFLQAGQINDQTKAIRVKRAEMINTYDPALITSQYLAMDLQTKLDQIRRSQGPLQVAQSKPIMEELETLSYVFGIPGIEIISLRLNNTSVTVVIRVEDVAQAEQINQSLIAIDGSHLRWKPLTYNNRGQKIETTFNARWQESEGES